MSNRAVDSDSAVHMAVLRRVRPGKEVEFEDSLRDFIRRSLEHEGTTGAHLLHPSAASAEREYGILRSFRSQAARDAFYDSDLFAEWQAEVAPLVEGEPTRRPLDALEGLFCDQPSAAPPKWKMAVIIWMGVFPSVVVWRVILAPVLAEVLPSLVFSGVLSACVVVTLTWVVTPLLTRLFQPWLHPSLK